MMFQKLWRVSALGVLFAGALPSPASAQADPAEPNRVMVVPYSQENPGLPYPTHSLAPITLKATVRNATCAGNYTVCWDVDMDGSYDDEVCASYSRNDTTLSIWDIGRTYLVPQVDRERTLNLNVRVTVPCATADGAAGHFKFGSMALFVNTFVPSADPRNWTEEQRTVMAQGAVAESLWSIHRKMNSFTGGPDTAELSGYHNYGYRSRTVKALSMWFMTVNGHLPAYPPGRMNWFDLAPNADWEAANNARWNADPFAETNMRMVNDSLVEGARTTGLAAGEEEDTCGYEPLAGEEPEEPVDPEEPGPADFSAIRSLTLELMGTCDRAAHDFFLNGVYVGTVDVNYNHCTCNPPVDTLTIQDPQILALWDPDYQSNEIRVEKRLLWNFDWQYWAADGTDWPSTTMWVAARVTEATGDQQQRICVKDQSGRDCTGTDVCNGPTDIWPHNWSSGGPLPAWGAFLSYMRNDFFNGGGNPAPVEPMPAIDSVTIEVAATCGDSPHLFWLNDVFVGQVSVGNQQCWNECRVEPIRLTTSDPAVLAAWNPEAEQNRVTYRKANMHWNMEWWWWSSPPPMQFDNATETMWAQVRVTSGESALRLCVKDYADINGWAIGGCANYDRCNGTTDINEYWSVPAWQEFENYFWGIHWGQGGSEWWNNGRNPDTFGETDPEVVNLFERAITTMNDTYFAAQDVVGWRASGGNDPMEWWNSGRDFATLGQYDPMAGQLYVDGMAEANAFFGGTASGSWGEAVEIGSGVVVRECANEGELFRPVKRCARIAGTAGNNVGAVVANADQDGYEVYVHGMYLGGVTPQLVALAGTPLQLGEASVRGWPWERLVQDMVDHAGYAQLNGRADCDGGWEYRASASRQQCSPGNYDLSSTQWMHIGLESAEIAGRQYGVFVNNRHKYRLANGLLGNQQADGGGAYRSGWGGASSFQLTGGHVVSARWLGIQSMPPNGTEVPFPGESCFTQSELRQSYDRYMAYIANGWNRNSGTGTIGWADRLFRNGSYLCGNTNAAYHVPQDAQSRCGNTYAMYSMQKGFRTGFPELQFVGEGGPEWQREFETYYIRSMDRPEPNPANPWDGYADYGQVRDYFCDEYSVGCGYSAGDIFTTGMAGMVLTPTIFNPNPVAIGRGTPIQVVESCSGANAGRVTFEHSASFHPNRNAQIIAYQWDVDASNGLWWAENSAPDFSTDDLSAAFVHPYGRAGNYVATLRVVDSVGQTKTTTVNIRVDASANVAPSAAHGGPYVMEVNQNLQLLGNATDGNLACGDTITVAWDLTNNGVFNNANGATANVAWATLQGLARGVPVPIRIRVTDQAGLSATAETTLTIYPREPVASGRANPNPATCRAEVTFDASNSVHPSPLRTISQYDWDVDGVAGFDGSGQLFRFTYNAFGTYQATLRVTDDLGRSHSTTFPVAVTQGNQPPVARVAAARIDLLEDQDLVLDGRPSSEPNTDCGDSIVEYAWDLNGNGSFNDVLDVRGANPTVPWITVANTLQWPADRATDLPANTVRLRVRDSFGLTATSDVVVRVFRANPIARVVQSPQPSPIRIDTGFSNTSFDGRESAATAPGASIVRYDWDLDDNGTFETGDRAVAELRRTFDPVPLPPAQIPPTFVRLRVTDSNGRTNVVRYPVVFRIPPTPPTADADPTEPPERGYHILVGEDLEVDGSRSFDPDSGQGDFIRFYRWDLTWQEADGFQANVQGEAANAPEQAAAALSTVTWAQLEGFGIAGPGNHTIRLQIEDTTLLQNVDDAPLSVYAVSPVAAIDANPNPVACGGRVTFDGGASNHPHPDIDVVSYSWDFGDDGQADAAGQTVQRTFDQFTFGNPIPVRLAVTDSRGNVGSTVVNIAVTEGNRPPNAVAGGFRDAQGLVVGPYAIVAGEGLALSAAGSAEPDGACGDAIVSYEWDLGNNGTVDATGAQANLTWAQIQAAGINAAGTYDVRLRVTDRFGQTSESVVSVVVVGGPRAVAASNVNLAGCDQQVTFSAANSGFDGPAGQGFDLVAYAWDLDNDGQFDDANGVQVTRAVSGLPGPDGVIRYTARVQVTDASGRTATGSTEVIINVQNVPPVAVAGGPYVTGPGGAGFVAVNLDGRGSFDPNAPCDSVVVYRWDTDNDGLYGDQDNPADLMGATVAYTNPNWQVNTNQTVRLVACDRNNGCSAAAEATINVRAQVPPSIVLDSPRAEAGLCYGSNPFEVQVTVADPTGDPVDVTVTIGGVQVASERVNVPADGSPVVRTLQINPGLVPEGSHSIEVRAQDAPNSFTTANSGGRISFDRTPPVVTIGVQPTADACYSPNAIPATNIGVVDALDNAPRVDESIVQNGCGRTLRVTGTDACGNVGFAERSYRIAENTEIQIDGADEGALVASARVNWSVVGPPSCVSNIAVTVSRDGGAAQAYPANQLLDLPGTYAMTFNVGNCLGVARQTIRSFTINAPPVAVVIPPGHPNADPNQANAYIALEGSGLQLDGTASLAPEVIERDRVVRYEWDFNGDGVFDAEGALVDFSTNDNGVFVGTLRVTDNLGASSTAPFRVTVLDVDPIANAGGPYAASQGVVFQADGRGSRPGSAADPIALYTWNFGDGSPPVSGANLSRPEHTYASDGTYTLRLTVRDEDSEHTVEVQVTVADVSPIIDRIIPPEDAREFGVAVLRIEARPGAADEGITRYEWDVDGDGVTDYAGPGLTEVEHQYDRAGQYTVSVRVRDRDSSSLDGISVSVRELTLKEIVEWIDASTSADRARLAAELASGDPNYNVFADFALGGLETFIDRGVWGETYDERGVTLMALETIVARLVEAQAAGLQYGDELWALSRQLVREMTRQQQAVLSNEDRPRDADHPSMQLAAAYLETMEDDFSGVNFRADLRDEFAVDAASDLLFAATEAFYWLSDSVDQCNDYNDFRLPAIIDPLAVQPVANAINSNGLTPALVNLSAELDTYSGKGGVNAPAPARDRMVAAVEKLAAVRALQIKPLGPLCEEDEGCITDREALEMELLAAELARDLESAGTNGAWVRNWQSCMVLMLKFRIELSIQRVEFACGRNTAVSQRARRTQQTGLEFVQNSQDAEALSYYMKPEQLCTLVQVYDQCLVDADPEVNLPYDGPLDCPE